MLFKDCSFLFNLFENNKWIILNFQKFAAAEKGAFCISNTIFNWQNGLTLDPTDAGKRY